MVHGITTLTNQASDPYHNKQSCSSHHSQLTTYRSRHHVIIPYYLSSMKLDVMAIGSHPDDVELGCSGTLIKEINGGKKVGIIDLTQGELGTRGTIETRYQEAANAAMVMGVSVRENLKMRDGFF